LGNLSVKQIRWLKSFHVLFAGIWVACGVVILAFSLAADNIQNGDRLYMLNYLVDLVDMKILVPSAMLCLLTGLIYSLGTKWGFFKYRWLIFKWIVTVGIIVLGTIFTGPWIEEMVEISLKEGAAAIQNSHYAALDRKQFIMGIFMNGTLIVTVFISVFKPWNKNNK